MENRNRIAGCGKSAPGAFSMVSVDSLCLIHPTFDLDVAAGAVGSAGKVVWGGAHLRKMAHVVGSMGYASRPVRRRFPCN